MYSPHPRFFTLLLPAILFVLAFSAKSTSVFGPMAVCAMFWFSGRRKSAIQLAAIVGVGVIAFAGIVQYASDGRFLQTMRACASADADSQTLFTAPAALLKLIMKADPTSIAFLLLAVVALLHTPAKFWRELPAMFLVATTVITLLVFGSPGVFLNHLIDLQIAAVVFIAVQIARERIPTSFGTLAYACAAILAVAGTAQALKEMDSKPTRENFGKTLAMVHDHPGRVLYEHPMLAVVDGQSPVMLDPFMFAVAGAKDSKITSDLWNKLDHKYFSAIVLLQDPADHRTKEWFDMSYFGAGFVDNVLKNYQKAGYSGSDFIYIPKAESRTANEAQASDDDGTQR